MKKGLLFGAGLAAAGFLLFSASPSRAEAVGKLKLSAVSGKAPLTVRVVGPRQLVVRGAGQPQKWVGCGMYVDWGDGKTPVTVLHCSDYLVHTYNAPGRYIVKAVIFHPGPDDGPVTDWEDKVEVRIE